MAITYTLKPLDLIVAPHRDGEQDVVLMVAWSYVAVDGPYTAVIPYATTPVPFTSGGSFTPFEQLTQEQVVTWVLTAWPPEQRAMYQQRLIDDLDSQRASPLVTLSPPWATAN